MGSLRQVDPEISRAVELERKRIQEKINLIASENYPSRPYGGPGLIPDFKIRRGISFATAITRAARI